MGAPTADPRGNATGRTGKSACGALGYAKVDSHYADTTVIITDNLVNYVHNYAIPQTDVELCLLRLKALVIQKVSLLVR